MKKYPILVALIFAVVKVLAQQSPQLNTGQSNAYYLDKSHRLVNVKDSAQTAVVVAGFDTLHNLYTVFEYDIKSGKRIMVATSSKPYPLFLNGICTRFYISGKRKSFVNYTDNSPTDTSYYYFPNGKLYQTIAHKDIKKLIAKYHGSPNSIPETEKQSIVACFDSTGHMFVDNGNGHFIGYTDDFKKITEEGDLHNGQKNGMWRGEAATYSFEELYKDGKFIKGTSIKNGVVYTYNQFEKSAEFKGGITQFYNYLNHHLPYPESARQNKISGKVFSQFIIDVDGSVTDIRIIRSPDEALSNVTIQALTSSPKWQPGTQRGVPVRQMFTVPLDFNFPGQ